RRKRLAFPEPRAVFRGWRRIAARLRACAPQRRSNGAEDDFVRRRRLGTRNARDRHAEPLAPEAAGRHEEPAALGALRAGLILHAPGRGTAPAGVPIRGVRRELQGAFARLAVMADGTALLGQREVVDDVVAARAHGKRLAQLRAFDACAAPRGALAP